MARKNRDCPKCGTETEVKGSDSPTARGKRRVCPNPDCNWYVKKSGRWTSPRNVEPGWWANL